MKVRIEKVVYGGLGMARTKAGVVFVAKVLPQELVEIEIVEQKKDYANALLLEVLEGSSDRRDPTCPNFWTVGCCDWDYVRLDAQWALKETIIRESLQRLGRVEWTGPIERIAGRPEGYRMRARFHTVGGRLGFVQEKSHQVIPIAECAALAPPLNAFIAQANSALGHSRFKKADSVRAIASPQTGEVAASFVSGRHRTPWTPHFPITRVLNVEYRLQPDRFFQPNWTLLEGIASEVLRAAADEADTVLDLYCGSGFFSLLLARYAKRVVGVDRRSVSNAQWNARRNGIANVEFIKASAIAFLTKSGLSADTVVLDPPRKGAGRGVVERLLAVKPKKIVYISCNPTTLAGEARRILNANYQLTSLKFVDQFPNTHHIETVAVFHKA